MKRMPAILLFCLILCCGTASAFTSADVNGVWTCTESDTDDDMDMKKPTHDKILSISGTEMHLIFQDEKDPEEEIYLKFQQLWQRKSHYQMTRKSPVFAAV